MEPQQIQTESVQAEPKIWGTFEAEYQVVRGAMALDVPGIKEILAIPKIPLHRIEFVEEEICQAMEKKTKIGETYEWLQRRLNEATFAIPELDTKIVPLEAELGDLRVAKAELVGLLLPKSSAPLSPEDQSQRTLLEKQIESSASNIRHLNYDIQKLQSQKRKLEEDVRSIQIDIQRLGAEPEKAMEAVATLEEIRLLVRGFGNDRHYGRL